MNFATNLARSVASTTNQYGIRSSKRTDDIHNFIAKHIMTINPRTTCKVEYKLKTELGDFNTDIMVFDKSDNIVACILFKALISSIGKNEKNYEHNKIGEAVKAKSGMPSDAKIVFLDVIPVRCPIYNKDGKVKSWECHPPATVREKNNTLMRVTSKLCTGCIHDIYTLFADYKYSEDKSLEVESVVDESDMQRFTDFILALAPDATQSSSDLSNHLPVSNMSSESTEQSGSEPSESPRKSESEEKSEDPSKTA